MRMREADLANGEAAELAKDLGCVIARIDDKRILAVRIGHHVAVRVFLADVDLLDRKPRHDSKISAPDC